jgi:DNA-directed RNA polymerase
MHSDDIVGRLAAEFNKRYDGHYYLAQINRNNVLGRAIVKYRKDLVDEGVFPKGSSAKAVQQQRHVELAREVRKKKLMASDDPVERKEGEEMVTAAALYEKHDGDRYLFTRDSLGETAIGMVPESAEVATEGVLDTALNATEVAGDVDLAGTLDPLRDSVANDHDEDALDVEDHRFTSESAASSHDINVFGQKVRKPKKQNKQGQSQQMWLWLPIKFRPVPQKGDFDVKRLKDSVYFFS